MLQVFNPATSVNSGSQFCDAMIRINVAFLNTEAFVYNSKIKPC